MRSPIPAWLCAFAPLRDAHVLNRTSRKGAEAQRSKEMKEQWRTGGYNRAMNRSVVNSATSSQAAKPRRRRYQFSLKSLMVLVAVSSIAIWWWSNFLACSHKAEFYGSRRVLWMGSSFSMGPYSSQQTAGYDWAASLNRTNEDLERAYRYAAWFPWLRPGIHDESVPVNPPVRYRGDYLFVGYSAEEIVFSDSTVRQ